MSLSTLPQKKKLTEVLRIRGKAPPLMGKLQDKEVVGRRRSKPIQKEVVQNHGDVMWTNLLDALVNMDDIEKDSDGRYNRDALFTHFSQFITEMIRMEVQFMDDVNGVKLADEFVQKMVDRYGEKHLRKWNKSKIGPELGKKKILRDMIKHIQRWTSASTIPIYNAMHFYPDMYTIISDAWDMEKPNIMKNIIDPYLQHLKVAVSSPLSKTKVNVPTTTTDMLSAKLTEKVPIPITETQPSELNEKVPIVIAETQPSELNEKKVPITVSQPSELMHLKNVETDDDDDDSDMVEDEDEEVEVEIEVEEDTDDDDDDDENNPKTKRQKRALFEYQSFLNE